MGITTKINSSKALIFIQNIFIFLFLAIFPFGQIIRLSFNFAGINIPLQPIDIIVGLGALFSVVFQKSNTKALKFLGSFLIVAAFSFILSIFYFKSEVIYGLFYLIRIISYVLFINYTWGFVNKRNENRKLVVDSLLAVSIFSAVFGWFQFVIFPDIKPFFVYGWDMHLFRLVGTFLDPTFLGLIIVFGLIISINRLIKFRKKKYLAITLFLLLSLAFTYSRASYLAFLGGVFVLGFVWRRFKRILILISILIIVALMLPTARNHSIELTRTFSISARLNNYKEAIQVFKKFPVFGVGYDNLCVARNRYIGIEDFSSHACSGSDSSLLLLLATTGMVGLTVFMFNLFNISKLLKSNNERLVLISSSVALLIHSFFSNSLFFPWVMGYMALLLAVSLKE